MFQGLVTKFSETASAKIVDFLNFIPPCMDLYYLDIIYYNKSYSRILKILYLILAITFIYNCVCFEIEWVLTLTRKMTSRQVHETSVNQQQFFSVVHQPGRSTNHKHWLTWVTTNNSSSQDHTNLDDQPTTNIGSPGSQPTTVLLRTTPTRKINQLQTLTHLGHNQQQSSELH